MARESGAGHGRGVIGDSRLAGSEMKGGLLLLACGVSGSEMQKGTGSGGLGSLFIHFAAGT